jgi:hypothetical protein
LLILNAASLYYHSFYPIECPSLLIAQYRNKIEDWCWSEKAMGKEAWNEDGAGDLLL